jgi:molybdopterin-guanine dinucleotide biosynthesis protein A
LRERKLIADCTALILAGGNSKRMGQDKASLPLNGQTLLQHVVATMQQLFPEVIVSVRQPRPESDMPQVCDDPAHTGPLAGLAAGLERATTPWVFAVACDMPFVTPAVIELLAGYRAKPPSTPPCASIRFADCLLTPLQGGSGGSSLGKGRPGGVGFQAVVPIVHGHPQPLAAFYARNCLEEIHTLLSGRGKHSLRALLDQLQVCYVSEQEMLAADPQLRSFFDLDTPQDMAQAMNQVL